MKRLLLIYLSLACLPFIPAEARGCTCNEYNVPICAAYWRADAVFAGQLLDITSVEKKSDDQMPTVMLQFIVEQPFRGVAGNRLNVETLNGTSCEMKLNKGERYIIYAARDQSIDGILGGHARDVGQLGAGSWGSRRGHGVGDKGTQNACA